MKLRVLRGFYNLVTCNISMSKFITYFLVYLGQTGLPKFPNLGNQAQLPLHLPL